MRRKSVNPLNNSIIYWEIVLRDKITCQICRKRGRIIRGRAVCRKDECSQWIPMEIDHIVPLALGGENTTHNLRLACRRCNRSKGAKHHAI